MLGVERDVSFQELGKNDSRFANEINQGNLCWDSPPWADPSHLLFPAKTGTWHQQGLEDTVEVCVILALGKHCISVLRADAR